MKTDGVFQCIHIMLTSKHLIYNIHLSGDFEALFVIHLAVNCLMILAQYNNTEVSKGSYRDVTLDG